MKNKKIMAISAGVVSVCTLSCGIYSFAVENKASLKDQSMENGFIRLTVDQDDNSGEYLKFCLDSTGGQVSNNADDNKNLTYNRFCSGYTTLNINGVNYVYGRGTDVEEARYDAENGCHISAQKFGDVVIEQTLTFSEGYTSGYNDMLRISYKVLESNENDSIGVRILIDPTIENDDMLSASAEGVKISRESDFNKDIPKSWKAEMTMNSDIAAYGKTDGVPLEPTDLIFVDWSKIYDELWDYTPDVNYGITDLGVAVKWNPVSNPESQEFVTYYGIKNEVNNGKGSSNSKNDKDNKEEEGSDKAKLNSPQTGVSVSPKVIGLFIASVASSAACIVLGKKEKNDEE